MAIAQVGSVGTTSNNAGTTAVLTVPTGVVNGDVMVVCVGSLSGSSSITPPAGWTAIDSGQNVTNLSSGVWYRIASGETAGTTTYTWTSPTGRIAGAIVAYTGVAATVIDNAGAAHAVTSQTTASTSLVFPSVTTATSGALVLGISLARPTTSGVTATNTPPASWTEIADFGTNTGANNNVIVEINTISPSVGALGTSTATSTQSSSYATYTFALQPAASSSSGAGALTLTAAASDTLTFTETGSAALTLSAAATDTLKFTSTGTAAVSLTATALTGASLSTTGSASISLTAALAINPVQLVQKVGTVTGGPATSLTLTSAAGTTTGNGIIVAVEGATSGTATVTDSASNTYTLDVSNGSSIYGVRVFSCRPATGIAAGGTITVTWSSSLSICGFAAYEFTGLAPGAVDTTSTAFSTSSTFNVNPYTVTGVGDLLFEAFSVFSSTNTTTYTPGGGATALDTVHNLLGGSDHDLFTEYKTGVTAGSYNGLAAAAPSASRSYQAAAVAYFAQTSSAATAQLTLTASAVTSPTSFATTGSASITLTALTNAQPVTGTAGLDLFAVAVTTLRVTATATAGLSLTGFAVPTQTHIPVETDLTFRVSTDDLIVDAAVTSLDAVTSITGTAGNTRQLGTDTTITADLTDNSQLAGYNAGQAKAVHLYRLKSKPRKNAPTLTVNAAPTAPKVNGDGTIGAGTWVTVGSNSPTAYQAAVAVDISDLILLSVIPPGGGDSLVARYWVEGIRHQITADGTWSVSLNISRADDTPTGGFWQLGQSRLGLETVLTW